MSTYNRIPNMQMRSFESFDQTDPMDMMMNGNLENSDSNPPAMDPNDAPMSVDMMARMVKSAPNYRETFDDEHEDEHEDDEHEDDEHEDEYEGFEDDEHEDDEHEDDEHEDDEYEGFEDDEHEDDEHEDDEHEDDEHEDFTDTNKDLELWTCYPSNLENSRETFESTDKYTADGDVSRGAVQGALAKSAVASVKESEMNKLYMYLAIAVVVLMIIYLLTCKNK